MVYVIRSWEDFARCLEYCNQVLYRVVEIGENTVEIRVKAGRVAWKGVVSRDSEKYREILRKLRAYGAMEVTMAIDDEQFMK